MYKHPPSYKLVETEILSHAHTLLLCSFLGHIHIQRLTNMNKVNPDCLTGMLASKNALGTLANAFASHPLAMPALLVPPSTAAGAMSETRATSRTCEHNQSANLQENSGRWATHSEDWWARVPGMQGWPPSFIHY